MNLYAIYDEKGVWIGNVHAADEAEAMAAHPDAKSAELVRIGR